VNRDKNWTRKKQVKKVGYKIMIVKNKEERRTLKEMEEMEKTINLPERDGVSLREMQRFKERVSFGQNEIFSLSQRNRRLKICSLCTDKQGRRK
jgi:hypothetical protein